MPKRAHISGLYLVTPEPDDAPAALLAVTEAGLAAGARIVQLRAKIASATARANAATALRTLCDRYAALLIVNDDIELARAVAADGVHLGREDAGIATARDRLGPQALIGASCYNTLDRALAAQAAGADYVAFGSFFPSPTKPGAVRATPELLEQARARVALPIVAIGGITPDNAPVLIAAGAGAVAVSSAFYAAADPAQTAARLVRAFTARRS